MRTTSKLAMAIAFAALAACGGQEANNDMNMTDLNATTDMNATMDMNADMNMGTDNLTVDANNVTVVENTSNAPDTTTNNAM